jgi:hypothetical protein
VLVRVIDLTFRLKGDVVARGNTYLLGGLDGINFFQGILAFVVVTRRLYDTYSMMSIVVCLVRINLVGETKKHPGRSRVLYWIL